MRYEITVLIELDPHADFYKTEEESLEVYSLVESAMADIDDFKVIELEVRENG